MEDKIGKQIWSYIVNMWMLVHKFRLYLMSNWGVEKIFAYVIGLDVRMKVSAKF